MLLERAPDIERKITGILKRLKFPHIVPQCLVCFRSKGATSRARARIWSFPRIWQMALGIPPHYVIEVLSEKFDRMSDDDQIRVLIHEILHIPKNFSGALVPHRGRFHRIDHRAVEHYFQEFKNSLQDPKL